MDQKLLDRLRDDFALIFYHWAQTDAAEQASLGFPLFSLLRDSLAADYVRIYQMLPAQKRDIFLRAMVKRTHERAVGIAREFITQEEQALIELFKAPPWEDDQTQREARLNRPRLTPADRKQLGKLVRERVAKETGGDFQNLTPTDFIFDRVCGPWKVSTGIEIKSKQNLGYEHSISLKENPEVRLKEYTSITRWLGIGETNWNLMTPDELEECAEAPIILAKYFLDAVPELLAKVSI